jgi:protein-disulfide isomerase
LRSASIVSGTRESCRAGYGVCVRALISNRLALFAAVGIAAVGIAVALIVVSVVGSSDKKASPTIGPTATTPATGSAQAPAKVPGAAATQRLFRGIPQTLNALGNPNAPVTMIEFGDLQCPFCREYTVNALPAIVDEYVRPGKVKLVFTGLAVLGPDSEPALRATYAAALQGKLWNYIDLLYKNQGPENSGWVTEGLLRAVGESIPGLDVNSMLAARSSPEIDNAIALSVQQAQSARVDRTPTFFAGKTGGTLEQVAISSLTADAFRPTLDALTK